VASALGHAASIVCRVLERTLGVGDDTHVKTWLRLLPGCIRDGFDDPDKLLLFRQLSRKDPGLFPRVVVYGLYAKAENSLPPWSEVFLLEERRWAVNVLLPDA
jgi:hypothetical protein